MQAALEIAAYVLGFTILLGVVLVAVLVKDLLFGQGFPVPHPSPQRLPTEALHALRDTLRLLKGAYDQADATGRQRLDLPVRRMRERLEHLEQKTIDDQDAYYKAVGHQERAWKHWKAVHNQVRGMARGDRQRAQRHLTDAERTFRQAARHAGDEWEKGLVRDRLNLEELRGMGVLGPDYVASLFRHPEPAPEPAPWDTLGAPEPAPRPAARPRPEDAGVGMLTYRALREVVRGALVNWRKATGLAVEPAPATPTGADAAGSRAAPPAPVAPPQGPWHQEDLASPGIPKAGRAYGDATFSLAALPQGLLRNADFSGSVFTAVEFTGVHRHVDGRFIGADLRGIVLGREERPHQFARCAFTQANCSGARITFALFHRCDLRGTRWYGAALDRVKFSECVLEGVDWGGADLSRTVFTEDAQGADFSTAAAPPLFVPAVGDAPQGDSAAGEGAAAESAPAEPGPAPQAGDVAPPPAPAGEGPGRGDLPKG